MFRLILYGTKAESKVWHFFISHQDDLLLLLLNIPPYKNFWLKFSYALVLTLKIHSINVLLGWTVLRSDK